MAISFSLGFFLSHAQIIGETARNDARRRNARRTANTSALTLRGVATSPRHGVATPRSAKTEHVVRIVALRGASSANLHTRAPLWVGNWVTAAILNASPHETRDFVYVPTSQLDSLDFAIRVFLFPSIWCLSFKPIDPSTPIFARKNRRIAPGVQCPLDSVRATRCTFCTRGEASLQFAFESDGYTGIARWHGQVRRIRLK